MRINIYAEEITNEVELVKKDAGGRTFYGIRFWLKSPEDLHHTVEDDDRSAVTLWVPWTKRTGNRPVALARVFNRALKLLDTVPAK